MGIIWGLYQRTTRLCVGSFDHSFTAASIQWNCCGRIFENRGASSTSTLVRISITWRVQYTFSFNWTALAPAKKTQRISVAMGAACFSCDSAC